MEINDAEASLSLLFHSLAHPTRRRILELVTDKALTLVGIAHLFPISMQATAKHLQLLESAGLLFSMKAGHVRTYSLTSATLDLGAEWLRTQLTEDSSRTRRPSARPGGGRHRD